MPEFFYAPPSSIEPRQIIISGEEARHISRTLRHRKGDQITVVDGQGGEYHCAISAISEGAVTVRIINKLRKSNEAIRQVALAQAVPKGQRMDFVIEKGTELGLQAIIPLVTGNSVVRPTEDKPGFNLPPLDDDSGGSKAARWQRIAIAAMKQSLRSVLPRIEEPVDFSRLAGEFESYDLVLMADQDERKANLDAVFSGLAESKEVRRVLCLVGPEGGFTQPEKKAVSEAKGHIVTLGPRRLRAETAGLVLSTLVLGKLGELG
jgi:16S rRNA (uracil1498-N3)-methyltransferase